MKVIKTILQAINNEVEIYGMGDLHIGSANCNLQLIQDLINYILKKKNRYVVFGGDMLDCTYVDSKGNVYENEMQPQEALAYAVKLLMPLVKAGRVLCSCGGNHDDDRSMRLIGVSLAQQLAVLLGIGELYSSDSIMLLAKVGKGIKGKNDRSAYYRIYISHGNNGGGGTMGSRANALEKMALIVPMADVYIHYHTHSPMVFKDQCVEIDEAHSICKWHERLFVNFNAFLNYFNSYAEKKLLKPQSQSIPVIRLKSVREFNGKIDRIYKNMTCEL
ncbi:MAG: metallophosphoesterase [Bacteroidales bacterium]|nr:metallophosphoesterase [Candidatus Scybalousia scybalohippi]